MSGESLKARTDLRGVSALLTLRYLRRHALAYQGARCLQAIRPLNRVQHADLHRDWGCGARAAVRSSWSCFASFTPWGPPSQSPSLAGAVAGCGGACKFLRAQVEAVQRSELACRGRSPAECAVRDLLLVLIGVGIGGFFAGWSFEPLGILKLSGGYAAAVICTWWPVPWLLPRHAS